MQIHSLGFFLSIEQNCLNKCKKNILIEYTTKTYSKDSWPLKDIMCSLYYINVSESTRRTTLTPDGLFRVACRTLDTVPASQLHQTATVLTPLADF